MSQKMNYTDIGKSITSTTSMATLENPTPIDNPYNDPQLAIPANIRIPHQQPQHMDNYYTRNNLQQWLIKARNTGNTSTTLKPTSETIINLSHTDTHQHN